MQAMWDVPNTQKKKAEELRNANNIWRKWRIEMAQKYVLGGKYSGWRKSLLPEHLQNPIPEVETEGGTTGTDVEGDQELDEQLDFDILLSTDDKKTVFETYQKVSKKDWDEFVKIRTEPGYAVSEIYKLSY